MKSRSLAQSRRGEALREGVCRANGHGRRVAQLAVLNAISTLFLTIAVSQGLADWTPAFIVLGYGWAGLLLVFALVGSGWSSGRADPTMSFELLVFAISAVALSYGLLDIARGPALEFLCLLLAFGMEKLSTRQLLSASFLAVFMLALASMLRITWGEGAVPLHSEVYNLLMAAVLLPATIVVGGEISRLYRLQAEQRSDLASTLARLTALSLHDGLTGLPNRRLMSRMIEQARIESETSGEGYCVAMLDIDWFKRINDGYGHAVGDLVLKSFSTLMTSALESRWTLARWGGEEFLLLMPGCSAAQAESALASCRRRMASQRWRAADDGLSITFSAGLAVSRPEESTHDTLQRADRGLYLAKANGRNRTEGSGDDIVRQHLPSSDASDISHDVAADDLSRPPTASGTPPLRSSKLFERSSFIGNRRDDHGASRGWPNASPSAVERLATALLSTSPDIRENLRLPLIACALHAVWMAAAYFYAIPHGQMDEWAAWVVICYEALSGAGFYAAIRSGWSRRFADGRLVMTQMLAASAMAAFGYVFAPELRPSILHMLCVIQVFGMVTLKPSEVTVAGAAAVGMLCLVMLCLLSMASPGLNAEILKLLLACTIVSQLAILSRGHSRVREDVQSARLELQANVAKVNEQATHDPLTGLLNRSYMEEALAQYHAAWLGGAPAFCLGILDLDHFKRINDEKGHQVRDAVLVALAQATRQSFRESDLLCRWGGEEFMCLLPGGNSEVTSSAAMQRLRAAFTQTMAEVSGIEWKVTFSSGFASPHDDVTPDELVAQADRALYRAKDGGRDRDVFDSGDPVQVHPAIG